MSYSLDELYSAFVQVSEVLEDDIFGLEKSLKQQYDDVLTSDISICNCIEERENLIKKFKFDKDELFDEFNLHYKKKVEEEKNKDKKKDEQQDSNQEDEK